jgi:bacteriocin-like protein
MNGKFQPLSADELSQVSGGFSFHISFLDVVTGGLDRLVAPVHSEVDKRITEPSTNESHVWDQVNSTPEGDPTDPGNPTLSDPNDPGVPRPNGAPFPGDGND